MQHIVRAAYGDATGHIFLISAAIAVVGVIAAVLLTNVALAVLGRAAPQLNIMSLAFPLQIGVGLIAFAGSIALVVHAMADWQPGFAGSLDTFARGTRTSMTAPAGAASAPLAIPRSIPLSAPVR